MRWMRAGRKLLSAVVLGLAGCQTANTTIKPPLHEEYILPPADDSRFSSPPTYPKETLDSSQFNKQSTKPGGDPLQGPGRFTGPGGMRGY